MPQADSTRVRPAARSHASEEHWREVHEQLRGIARRRAALDAEEANLLRQAGALQLWRKLGYSSASEYMERELGYAPRTAVERLRVADALSQLPHLAAALTSGELRYSAVRELSRVVTPETEALWIDATRGQKVRQVQTMVAGRRHGDKPDDPARARVEGRQRATFELSPRAAAALHQARAALEAELGSRLNDDAFIEALCRRALDPSSVRGHRRRRTLSNRPSRDKGRSAARMPRISEHLRKQVLERDERCVVPGCHTTLKLDAYPIRNGGKARLRLAELCTMCRAHGRALRAGSLTLTGACPNELEFSWSPRARSKARRDAIGAGPSLRPPERRPAPPRPTQRAHRNGRNLQRPRRPRLSTARARNRRSSGST